MRQPTLLMRCLAVSVAVLGLAGGARAETAACGVRVLEAPAELRRAIGAGLATLAACGGRLDVWISRNDAGLFVMARDEAGRVRTRQVPDPDVAAALLASWVEMDAAAHAAAPPAALTPAVAIVSAAPAPSTDVAERLQSSAEPRSRAARPSTFGITGFAGATTGGMTTTGAAIDVDVWHHEGLALGFGLLVNHDVAGEREVGAVLPGFFREAGRWGGAAMVELRRRIGDGTWRVTPAIGFGAGATRHVLLTADAGETTASERIDATFGFRVAGSVALGVRVATSVDLELTAGWMLRTYEARNGIDPTDHVLTAGIGLRHDR